MEDIQSLLSTPTLQYQSKLRQSPRLPYEESISPRLRCVGYCDRNLKLSTVERFGSPPVCLVRSSILAREVISKNNLAITLMYGHCRLGDSNFRYGMIKLMMPSLKLPVMLARCLREYRNVSGEPTQIGTSFPNSFNLAEPRRAPYFCQLSVQRYNSRFWISAWIFLSIEP